MLQYQTFIFLDIVTYTKLISLKCGKIEQFESYSLIAIFISGNLKKMTYSTLKE